MRKPGMSETAPQTSSQSLGSVVKSARDIVRKDKGLNGDLDRLRMLTWTMFPEFLDGMEEWNADIRRRIQTLLRKEASA